MDDEQSRTLNTLFSQYKHVTTNASEQEQLFGEMFKICCNGTTNLVANFKPTQWSASKVIPDQYPDAVLDTLFKLLERTDVRPETFAQLYITSLKNRLCDLARQKNGRLVFSFDTLDTLNDPPARDGTPLDDAAFNELLTRLPETLKASFANLSDTFLIAYIDHCEAKRKHIINKETGNPNTNAYRIRSVRQALAENPLFHEASQCVNTPEKATRLIDVLVETAREVARQPCSSLRGHPNALPHLR